MTTQFLSEHALLYRRGAQRVPAPRTTDRRLGWPVAAPLLIALCGGLWVGLWFAGEALICAL